MAFKAHPKSLTSLVRHLKDPAPAVRVHTAEALGHFDDPRLVPYLAAMLQDADEQLVISAARSLGALGTIDAAAPLAGAAARSAPQRAAGRRRGFGGSTTVEAVKSET
ncbi:MAG: HEAT repeat domain-containing protein [Comamonadaceae bacterium]|nr:HEAT repeat domain-containing protein [Comamonadaceae bacterium]